MKQWSRNPGRTPGCPSSSQHRGCHPRVAGERPLSPEAQSRGRVRAEPAGSPLPMQDTALGVADGCCFSGRCFSGWHAFPLPQPSLPAHTLRTAGPAPPPPPLPEGPAAQPSCPQLQGCGSGSGWSSQPRAQQPLAEAEWVAGERDGAGDVTCSDGATVKARRSCRGLQVTTQGWARHAAATALGVGAGTEQEPHWICRAGAPSIAHPSLQERRSPRTASAHPAPGQGCPAPAGRGNPAAALRECGLTPSPRFHQRRGNSRRTAALRTRCHHSAERLRRQTAAGAAPRGLRPRRDEEGIGLRGRHGRLLGGRGAATPWCPPRRAARSAASERSAWRRRRGAVGLRAAPAAPGTARGSGRRGRRRAAG